MKYSFAPVMGQFDRPVYVVGGGPSLEGFDFDRIWGLGYMLGCNKSAFWADCDGLITLDQHFARMHRNDIAEFAARGKDVWLVMPVNEDGHEPIPGAHYVIRDKSSSLSEDSREIHGVNTGFAALGLCYHMNAPAVALLGLDMQYSPDGKTHFHEGYSWHNKKSHQWMCRFWSKAFDAAKQKFDDKGIPVTNFVGPNGSSITCFEKLPLDEL